MSVKIRLAKAGKKHQITYRVVAQDTRSKRDGKFLDVLGFYNPYNTPSLEINKEKVAFWTKNGAVATLAVKSLMSEGKLTKKVGRRKLKQAQEQAAQPAKPTSQQEPKTENLQAEETVQNKQDEKPREAEEKTGEPQPEPEKPQDKTPAAAGE